MRLGRRRAAARHLRMLATLEALLVAGQIREAERLVDSIDPQECRELADELAGGIGSGRGNQRTEPTLALLPLPVHNARRVW